jgi:ABC-2 type transport system permease protein
MRKIFAIAWKDALLRFASRSELLFFLVLPLVFTTVIGGATSGSGDTRVPVLLVDADGGALAADLTNSLSASTAVRLVAQSQAAADQSFAGADYPALVTIPAGFTLALQAGQPASLSVRTLPNNLDALAAQQAIAAAADQVSQALAVAVLSLDEAERAQPFTSDAERTAYLADARTQAQAAFALAPARLVVIQATVLDDGRFTAQDARGQASAGQLITWVLVPLLGTSALFAFERERGTLRRLITTPTSRATYLLGVIGGQFTLAFVQMLLLVVFGRLVLHVNWGQDLPGLLVMLVTFGLAATALGTLLGTYIKTEAQANGLSIMLGMVMALLGGCWYPAEIFPAVARTAAKILPTTWAMQGLSDLVLRGQGFTQVLPEAAVLLGFAALFLALGVRRFRYE